mgnify:CR=1 FL=1
MATEYIIYIIAISFCCFGIGVTFGMMVPFIFIKLYNKMTEALDVDIYEDDLSGDKVSQDK